MTPEQARTLAATVKAEHADNSYGGCCGCRPPIDEEDSYRDAPWPCSAYRLADMVETLTAQIEALEQAADDEAWRARQLGGV